MLKQSCVDGASWGSMKIPLGVSFWLLCAGEMRVAECGFVPYSERLCVCILFKRGPTVPACASYCVPVFFLYWTGMIILFKICLVILYDFLCMYAYCFVFVVWVANSPWWQRGLTVSASASYSVPVLLVIFCIWQLKKEHLSLQSVSWFLNAQHNAKYLRGNLHRYIAPSNFMTF